MIVFDLHCAKHGHVFEAWFGSSRDFEAQQARALIACPLCGDTQVEKAIMAPNISAKGNTLPKLQSGAAMPVTLPTPSVPEAKAMLAALAKAQAAMLEKSTWVGRSFDAKARAMDVGDIAHSSIYGEVTRAEAEALVADGIGVMPLPLPVTPPERLN